MERSPQSTTTQHLQRTLSNRTTINYLTDHTTMSASTSVLKQVRIGFGLMGMTWRPNPQPFEASFKTIEATHAKGVTFWNGGEIYGTPEKNSLHLLRDYFNQHPGEAEKVILSIKGGYNAATHTPDGSPEGVKRSIDNCNSILKGAKKMDIFEVARFDPNVPIETTVEALAKHVQNGDIGAIGLSEVKASTIRKAHELSVKLTGKGIAGVEVELSLWATDILQNGVAATCAELGIPIVAYSPLARGALTENPIRKNSEIPDGDFRKSMPRFQDDALAVNNKITDAVKKIAERKGATLAQIAIGWVLGKSERTSKVRTAEGEEKEIKLGRIIPIPGATTVPRVEENFTLVELSESEISELDELTRQYPVQGTRYGEAQMRYVEA